MKVYVVGGFVRDYLMGLPSTDRDYVVVGATSQQMIDLGFKKVGADFEVFLHPHTGEEFALARTERKVAAGYLGFETDTSPEITLQQDLMRRDLTINAMAFEVLNWDVNVKGLFTIDTSNLIDYFNGYDDLQSSTLKHVSDAFREDPVRVLRLLRFAARYRFKIDPSTMYLARKMFESGELNSLTGERVFLEFSKVFADNCAQDFFNLLRSYLLPYIGFKQVDPLIHFFYPEKDMINFVNVSSVPKSVYQPQLAMLLLGFSKRQCEKMRLPNDYMWVIDTFDQMPSILTFGYMSDDTEQWARNILEKFKILKVTQHLELFKYCVYGMISGIPCNSPASQNLMRLVNSNILDNVYRIGASSVHDKSLTGKDLGDAIFTQRAKYLQRMMSDC